MGILERSVSIACFRPLLPVVLSQYGGDYLESARKILKEMYPRAFSTPRALPHLNQLPWVQ